MFLVNYSSSSSESQDEDVDDSRIDMEQRCKRSALPKASTLLGKRKLPMDNDLVTDNPSLHEGRIRSFAHERGNWATYVFISVPLNLLEDLQDVCLTAFGDKLDIKTKTELHISLSKTVVLQYHFIESFVKNLQDVFISESSFSISLDQLKVFTNAECTRTFLAVKVADIHSKKMLDILYKIDQVMRNFRLATFYEDPSFHISILWCVGDHVELINEKLAFLATQLKDYFPIQLKIDKIMCKSGFKEFDFELK